MASNSMQNFMERLIRVFPELRVSLMVVNALDNAGMMFIQNLPHQRIRHLFSLVNLIKWPCIRKAAVPDLIHHPDSLNVVLAVRSLGH